MPVVKEIKVISKLSNIMMPLEITNLRLITWFSNSHLDSSTSMIGLKRLTVSL